MKLFNVTFLKDNTDGSYLTIGNDNDSEKDILEREKTKNDYDGLQVKEIKDVDGYDIKIIPSNSNTNDYNKIKEWKGCTITSIKPLKKTIDGRCYSDREDSDITLVTNKFDVITVEDWNKWYNLYYITLDENYEPILVSFTFGDIIDGIDHYYFPESIVRFAKENKLSIDVISYIAICKMFMEDSGHMEDQIPDDVLPTLEDLNSVLTNGSGICTTFYLHHLYDVCTYDKYTKSI